MKQFLGITCIAENDKEFTQVLDRYPQVKERWSQVKLLVSKSVFFGYFQPKIFIRNKSVFVGASAANGYKDSRRVYNRIKAYRGLFNKLNREIGMDEISIDKTADELFV